MAEFGGGFSPPVRRQGMSERSPLLPRAHSPGGDESEALAWDDDLLPEAELKEDVPSSLLEHGRSITVGHRAFAAATHASAARVFASREGAYLPLSAGWLLFHVSRHAPCWDTLHASRRSAYASVRRISLFFFFIFLTLPQQ